MPVPTVRSPWSNIRRGVCRGTVRGGEVRPFRRIGDSPLLLLKAPYDVDTVIVDAAPLAFNPRGGLFRQ